MIETRHGAGKKPTTIIAARQYSDYGLYKRLLAEARPFWLFIAALFLLEVLAIPLALLNPVPLKIVVDSVLGAEPLPGWLTPLVPSGVADVATRLLFFAVALLVAVALLGYLRVWATWLMKAYAGNKLLLSFRAKLFSHIQELPFTYHDSRGSTDSMYRIQSDTVSIQQVATQGVIPFISNGATLIVMIWITMQIDWSLAIVALCIVPPLFVLTNISRKIIKKQWSSLKAEESSAISVVQETLGALRVVKAFGKESAERERFRSKSDRVVRGQVRVALTDGGFDLLIGVTIALGSATVLFIGVRHVQTGIITLGELLLVLGYLAQLYTPLQTITKTIAQLQSALVGAERVFLVLDEEPHVVQRENARPIERAFGEVEFREVDFAYEGERLVLRNSSFRVPAQSRVGIFGPTGAGKTSLVSLMLRFYDPIRGSILLDGVDLREYDLTDLRRQFGIVLQEPVLFSASIAENIAYSRPNATQGEIIEAAKAANAHDFISTLPDGYDTMVGERGMRLSGGERQRISLARAFLRNAPILVLDEPTSAVDTKTESLIIEALDRLTKGRTTFMIAHRLSTLESCDMWLRLERDQPVQVLSASPSESDELLASLAVR